jgi:pimeloyl-ACP methyl ester carboxylesterase
MPIARVNGVELCYQVEGSGDPLVLVHGSWADRHNWQPVVGPLAKSFQVVTYDRRGHSDSERPTGQGSVFEDVDDLAALIHHLGLAPANVVGNSAGAAIAVHAAIRRPEILRTLIAHEPPLFPLLVGTEFEPALAEVQQRIQAVVSQLEAGQHEEAARRFVDTVAFGPDAWDTQFTAESRAIFLRNAPTFLDETKDPDFLDVQLMGLGSFSKPALVTSGTRSAPFFGPVADRVAQSLPAATRVTIDGADHVPHLSMPDRYVEVVEDFLRTASADAG